MEITTIYKDDLKTKFVYKINIQGISKQSCMSDWFHENKEKGSYKHKLVIGLGNIEYW